jgi:CheY-like chemotaxis protein
METELPMSGPPIEDVARPRQRIETAEKALRAVQTSPLRVLLVEDHAETARLLSRLLECSGHAVTTAGNVESALHLAREGRFDVVVSDIGLPDGTGYELMKRIQQECPIPGVALTGYGMDDDLQRSTEAGFADHILKPIDAQHLEAVLSKVARNHRKV